MRNNMPEEEEGKALLISLCLKNFIYFQQWIMENKPLSCFHFGTSIMKEEIIQLFNLSCTMEHSLSKHDEEEKLQTGNVIKNYLCNVFVAHIIRRTQVYLVDYCKSGSKKMRDFRSFLESSVISLDLKKQKCEQFCQSLMIKAASHQGIAKNPYDNLMPWKQSENALIYKLKDLKLIGSVISCVGDISDCPDHEVLRSVRVRGKKDIYPGEVLEKRSSNVEMQNLNAEVDSHDSCHSVSHAGLGNEQEKNVVVENGSAAIGQDINLTSQEALIQSTLLDNRIHNVPPEDNRVAESYVTVEVRDMNLNVDNCDVLPMVSPHADMKDVLAVKEHTENYISGGIPVPSSASDIGRYTLQCERKERRFNAEMQNEVPDMGMAMERHLSDNKQDKNQAVQTNHVSSHVFTNECGSEIGGNETQVEVKNKEINIGHHGVCLSVLTLVGEEKSPEENLKKYYESTRCILCENEIKVVVNKAAYTYSQDGCHILSCVDNEMGNEHCCICYKFVFIPFSFRHRTIFCVCYSQEMLYRITQKRGSDMKVEYPDGEEKRLINCYVNEGKVKLATEVKKVKKENKENFRPRDSRLQRQTKGNQYQYWVKSGSYKASSLNMVEDEDSFCYKQLEKQTQLPDLSHTALQCNQLARILQIRPAYFPTQTVVAFPVTRPGGSIADVGSLAQASERPSNNMNMLMDHEVFRLCSFGYARFPPNEDILVTRLAHGGFYSLGRSGRVRCFSCGREYQVNLSGSPMDNVHEPHCQRHQLNKPLHEWMNDLPHDALSMYVREYGSLTPTLFEDAEPMGSSHQFISSAREFGDGPDDSRHHSSVSSGYGSRTLNASTTLPLSVSSAGASNDLDQSDAGFSDTGSHSTPVSGSIDKTNDASHSGHHQGSLPAALNDQHEVTQVSQESEPVIGNRNVLTSAARNPMAMDNRGGQRPGYGEAQGGNSSDSSVEGAEGGSEHFDLRRASYPQFASSHARRLTFSPWNPEHPQRPETLVAAGFFYAGYADCVRCFFCGLGLKFWRPTDIPAYQHARFRPQCVYNRMYKGQEYIDRVQQDVNPVQSANNPTESTTQPPPAAEPTAPEPQNSTHMRSEAAQQALRTGWSRDQVSQAIQHIVNEMGVGEIQQDLLTDVLAQLNPESEVLQGPGLGSADSESTNESEHLSDNNNENDPVDNTIASVRSQPPPPADQQTEQQSAGVELADGGAMAEPPAVSDPNSQEYKLVQRENVYLNERAKCTICNSRPVSCIFMPCGHVVACQSCADDMHQCIICGKEIIATANIFLA